MPTNRPDPGVTPNRTADADATSPPDPTQTSDASVRVPDLGGRPYPFLSPPTQPDDLGSLGPYRVVKLLGEGGMGFVFRGEDDALRRPVALKVMRPEVAAGENARERFLREGRAAAAVKSDHVITIYQVGEANGVPFLAMEFLAGCTLDDWLKGRGGSAPAAAIVKVAKDTLRGLGAAHDRGLIHRDIKPANLWLEAGTGRVKVLDFGLTRGSDDVLTREGALVGTPSYMAPEQAAGREVDPRADLFSVGVVLYRMASGKNPFQRGDVWATLTALAVDVPPPAGSVSAGLPAGLGELIDRLVAKTAAARPASARAALAEVERAMKGGTQPAVPVVNVPVVYAPPAAPEVNNTWAAVTEAVTEVEREPVPVPVTEAAKPRSERPASKMPLIAGLVGLAVVAAGAVGLALVMRGEPEVAKTPPPEEKEKGTRPLPAPKPPEELLVPAAGPVVEAGPSPFDALDPAKIPAAERVPWLPKETVAVLGGHRGETRGLVWNSPVVCSPDGKWFAITTDPLRYTGAYLYDATTLDVRWSRPRGGQIAFSPDGKWLACAVPEKEENGWEVELIDLTGSEPRVAKTLATLEGNGTNAVQFLADGKTLLTTSGYGDVRAFDYSGGAARLTHTLRAGKNPPDRNPLQLVVSADGKRLVDVVRGNHPSFAGVWDVSGEPKELFRVPGLGHVISFALAPDGGRLVILRGDAAGSTHHVDVWRLDGAAPTRESTTPLSGQFVSVGPVSADGKQVFLSGASAVVMDLTPAGVTTARAVGPSVMAARSDLSRFVQVDGQRFRVLDRDGKVLVEPGEQVSSAYRVPVAAGGRVLTFAPTARGWTVKDGSLVAEALPEAEEAAKQEFRPSFAARDGRHVAGIGADRMLRVLAVAPDGVRLASRLPGGGTPAELFNAFYWHPDGKRVVVPHGDGSAGVWDVATDPPTRTATWPLARPTMWLALAPAGDAFASFIDGPGSPILVQRPGDGKAARTLAVADGDTTTGITFAPDGRALYAGAIDTGGAHRLVRYDLTKRQPVGEPVRATSGGHAHRLAFSRDWRRLLGCTTGFLYVLDAATHGELLAVTLTSPFPHPHDIQASWADDGRHVLLGQHGCVYVLRVPDRPAPKP